MDKIIILSNRGYVVDQDGVLYNKKGVSIGSICQRYHRVGVRVGGKKVYMHTHRLQAYQKYGDKLFEEGVVVRHLDGDSTNNSWDNIAIGTQSDNMFDIPEQIRIKKARHAASSIKKYNDQEIRDFHKESRSYKKTMKKFNISSKGTLNYILNK